MVVLCKFKVSLVMKVSWLILLICSKVMVILFKVIFGFGLGLYGSLLVRFKVCLVYLV